MRVIKRRCGILLHQQRREIIVAVFSNLSERQKLTGGSLHSAHNKVEGIARESGKQEEGESKGSGREQAAKDVHIVRHEQGRTRMLAVAALRIVFIFCDLFLICR